MDNKFLKLISSPLMNLDHIYRYSGTKLVEDESLSQHIVDTVMLGLRVVDDINSKSGKKLLSTETYLLKAVYHDLEEAITGDVPRPLKYYDTATLSSMRNVADNVAHSFFSSQFHDEDEEHYVIWRDAKEGLEGYILKVVDTLVVVNKVVKEVSLLHNYYMLRVAHEVVQYLHEMKNYKPDIEGYEEEDLLLVTNYVSELIAGAIHSMDILIEDNKTIMDDLNIYGQSMI